MLFSRKHNVVALLALGSLLSVGQNCSAWPTALPEPKTLVALAAGASTWYLLHHKQSKTEEPTTWNNALNKTSSALQQSVKTAGDNLVPLAASFLVFDTLNNVNNLDNSALLRLAKSLHLKK